MNNSLHALTDFEEQKRELVNSSANFKSAIERASNSLGARAQKAGTSAIIIGGGLFLAYCLAKKIFSGKSKNKVGSENPGIVVRHPRQESFISSMIKEKIALFLIAIAKEKLLAYIKASKQNENNKPVIK